jgi:hypothetical protein
MRKTRYIGDKIDISDHETMVDKADETCALLLQGVFKNCEIGAETKKKSYETIKELVHSWGRWKNAPRGKPGFRDLKGNMVSYVKKS